MMLYEAVMVEIFRQALSASNPHSSSCEINDPSNIQEGRYITNSMFTCGNENIVPEKSPIVMAEYLNKTSASDGEQKQLLVANPLNSLDVQPTQLKTMPSNVTIDTPLFLLNLIKSNRCYRNHFKDESIKDNPKARLLLSTRNDGECPLDLSISSSRKRQSIENVHSSSNHIKTTRTNEYIPDLEDACGPSTNAYFGAFAAAELSPNLFRPFGWRSNDICSALVKGGELKNAEDSKYIEHGKKLTDKSVSIVNNSSGPQSAVKSHWFDKGAEFVKDVFKCVVCKKFFPSVEKFTAHMKESQHGGAAETSSGSEEPALSISEKGLQKSIEIFQSTTESSKTISTNKAPPSRNQATTSTHLLLNENIPLPRKLVRGQDVWLGKGAEQTREILKCMWCGQSFQSLAEMSSHMQETQHYMNIISQEQISSWKLSDGDKSTSGGSSNSTNDSPALTLPTLASSFVTGQSVTTAQTIITCKDCEAVFSSLKELINHMEKKSHYKQRGNRKDSFPHFFQRYRETREKRKKSLPVRKLLELERTHTDSKVSSLYSPLKPLPDFASCPMITCENCETKIKTAVFVEHIRQCLVDLKDGSKKFENFKHTPNFISQKSNNSSKRVNSSPQSPPQELLDNLKKNEENSPSVPSGLLALERLIEKNFETGGQQSKSFFEGYTKNTNFQTINLNKQGIDDKTFIEVNPLHFLNPSSKYFLYDGSTSECSSLSENLRSRIEAHTPTSFNELSTKKTENFTENKINQINKLLKEESLSPEKDRDLSEEENQVVLQEDKVFKFCTNLSVECKPLPIRSISPCITVRPTSSRSPSPNDRKMVTVSSSLSALSSMFNNLDKVRNGGLMTECDITSQNADPLVALQNLCEATDNRAKVNNNGDKILNDPNKITAVMNDEEVCESNFASPDLLKTPSCIIQCELCDVYCSRAEYTYHISKVHHIKNVSRRTHNCLETNRQSPKRLSTKGYTKIAMLQQLDVPNATTINSNDENLQSKFLKYTELAKQLSSKHI